MGYLAASGAGLALLTPIRRAAGIAALGVACADYCQVALHGDKLDHLRVEVVKPDVGGRRGELMLEYSSSLTNTSTLVATTSACTWKNWLTADSKKIGESKLALSRLREETAPSELRRFISYVFPVFLAFALALRIGRVTAEWKGLKSTTELKGRGGSAAGNRRMLPVQI